MSRQELADQVNACLYGAAGGHPQLGGIDSKYVGKLERGVYRWPNELYRRAFRQVLKAATDAELGFFVTRQPRQDLVVVASSVPTSAPSASSEFYIGRTSAPDGSDWPVWFGMRLAQAVSMVHNWTGVHSDALQTVLHQEI